MTSTATTRSYLIDPAHSSVHFSVRHLMISKVRGTFRTISGSIQLPVDGPIPVAINTKIDAASVDTREAQRDAHLKSADFLDVEQYSHLRFTSTRIEPIDATHFKVFGELEVHGSKQPVALDAEVTGQGKDPWGNDRVAFEATARINRKDFGLVWNQTLETGGVVVGDQVDITLDVESIASPA